MTDTMLSFANNQISNNFLSENDIMVKCPNAFKTEPTNPGVSERYVQATTIDVIRDMAKLGWYPVEAKQCRNKKGSKGIRSFHMIAFQNPDVKVMEGDEVEAYPRIILTNSHDGFNSFKFMVGLFRCVCSNGLIIADAQYANMTIRHINYTFEELRLMIVSAIEKLPSQIECLNNMKETVLTDEQKSEIAVKAIRLKKGIEEGKEYIITKDEIMDILTPVRDEDKGNSLWATFNIIQEKLMKGGYYLSNGKKSRKQRGITSIKKDIDLNYNLYNIAVSYAASYAN